MRQQQVFSRVEVRSRLVAVVDVESRTVGKFFVICPSACCCITVLLSRLCTLAASSRCARKRRERMPLVLRAVLRSQAQLLITLPIKKQKTKEDDQESPSAR